VIKRAVGTGLVTRVETVSRCKVRHCLVRRVETGLSVRGKTVLITRDKTMYIVPDSALDLHAAVALMMHWWFSWIGFDWDSME
jgi:hypothetical protein